MNISLSYLLRINMYMFFFNPWKGNCVTSFISYAVKSKNTIFGKRRIYVIAEHDHAPSKKLLVTIVTNKYSTKSIGKISKSLQV